MTGRAQRFGDNINTDYIIAAQHKVASLDISEMAKYTLEDIDPDFVHRVRPGDVVVAGRNFGCGSSREAAVHVLKALEVRAVLAASFARIYFRNAVNSGLSVLECDTSGIEQDDEIDIDLVRGAVVNLTRNQELPVTPLPPVMQAVLAAGGVAAYLREHGDFVLPPTNPKTPQPATEPGDAS